MNYVTLHNDIPVTSTETIALATENQHKSVIQLVDNNINGLEQFGLVTFEMRPRLEGQHGGGDTRIALLNERQATLLITFMRNSPIVKDFKIKLVREFYELAEQVRSNPIDELEMIASLSASMVKQRKLDNARMLAVENKIDTLESRINGFKQEDVVPANMSSTSTIHMMLDYYLNAKKLQEILKKNLPLKMYNVMCDAGIKQGYFWNTTDALTLMHRICVESEPVREGSDMHTHKLVDGNFKLTLKY